MYEQLSTHNLTLTAKAAEGRGEAVFASLREAPGFTEWSNPL